MNIEIGSIENSNNPPTASVDTEPAEDSSRNDAIDKNKVVPLAIEESEDSDDDVDALSIAEAKTPNNNFCFTEEDFLETQTQINNATRHLGTYKTTW